jgi:hypothetical protein
MVIKIKMESDPIEEAEPEAIIPIEVVSSGGQSATNSTGTTGRLRRKAARRSEPLFIRRSPRRLGKAAAEDVPARKKPRLEEPLPTTTDEAASKNSSPEVSVGLPSPPAADADGDIDDANTNADPSMDTQPNVVATGSWTLEEDAKLTSAFANTSKKKCGKEYKRDWVAVAALVPGRSNMQCNSRWQDVLDPDRANERTGKWAEDEDSKLEDAVQTHGGKNWGKISALVPGRSRLQCTNRWHHTKLDPSIDRASGCMGKWTAVEDNKLKGAVQTHGSKNWAAISELVASRTKRQCKYRWQDALDPSIALTAGGKGKWTAIEDSKLRDAVQTHGGKNWAAISKLVPGRTRIQCYNRWKDALDPGIALTAGSKGKWTAIEDSKLQDAARTHGGMNWAAITSLVPGRTRSQCNDRWSKYLDPSIDRANARTGKWTADEDSKLKDAVLTHGGKDWDAIFVLVPGRTKTQCRSRWQVLRRSPKQE